MILVVGATGVLGGRVTQQLLAQGQEVRIVVRADSPAEVLAGQGLATSPTALVAAGAEKVTADLRDTSSMTAALAGVNTVITTATAITRGDDAQLEATDLHGMRNFIDAAAAAGVDHFIFTSVMDTNPESPIPLIRYKGLCEVQLRESGMNYTFIKPSIFIEIWVGGVVGIPLQAGQPVTLFGKGDHAHNFISIADAAAYIVTAVDNPKARNQALVIGGPASHSWTGIVNTASEVLGQKLPIHYEPLTGAAPLLAEAINPGFVEMFKSFEMYEDEMDITATAAKYDIEPTPLATAVGRLFAAPPG